MAHPSPDASTTVVVVGAGPSGLMLACNLVRYGIPVVILDDRLDKTSTGKADGMQPKTIETFKQLRLADSLLRNGVRVYDISFWESTENTTLHRKGRQIHYPDHLVGAADPYILLAHQGMIEGVLIEDIEARGVRVTRNSRFIAWVIDTDFPDLWSKVAVRSHSVGSILWIPRERNMTRLYVELSSTEGERVDKTKATPEYVMALARKAMAPFKLEWKSIEWFGNYVVGQRVASHFNDDDMQIFIAGDAGHCHSALAAQGANTSMHDSFNLAWKLNLVCRGLAKRSLLATYEEERRKVAMDLIRFDAEHCNAFEQGEVALAKNFDDNIRFISGVGAEYSSGLLTKIQSDLVTGGALRPGALLAPAKVTRYIDANPVDIQLDIPMLGQFRIYVLVPDILSMKNFLDAFCARLKNPKSILGRESALAQQSYNETPRGKAASDEYVQPQRYTTVSHLFTLSLVTKSSKSDFELSDLPDILQQSRWTLYLDNADEKSCTDKWVGKLNSNEAAIINVRPDGYVGSLSLWTEKEGDKAADWVEEYYASFLT
ncbi:3-hydroxybenzoate 4-monooxygenase [Aspergillus lentulus]|uniref:3-hydroxybenzoate 4-monooxygenase n=1 Tax=Aspergillus lentulus TaxID=293939 RepID=UPI00139410E3|nr:3-hydroxybenzoate 4-monooxygenase [Aspergillus lentulus]GFF39607.1 3-hydroxybenzoate 4-monooxygenase [Aspergillus lentulus]